jgi:nitrogen fixation/metabolism regulation signal transduction histidine kinase
MGIRKPILWTIALLVPAKLLAAEALPRTILFLDQSETRGPFYQEVFSGFRDAVNADLESHVTIYRESLDLSRFTGASYEQTLHDYLQEKYRDRPIGAIVAIGAGTLELVRRGRAEFWQHTPVVFALVDEAYLDSGSGIPPNKLKQIFDRFFTTKEQGMGVGLSIARTIVQAHKGQIWAENQREGGAVFWISLPLS